MNKLRLALVALSLGLLVTPLNLTGSANQLPGSYADTYESSIYGNVRIQGTPSGHFTVAVDASFPPGGTSADGMYDVLFHFVPKKSRTRYQNVAVDLEGATVSFTSKRLTVLSAERHILLNLTLERDTARKGIFDYYNDVSRDLPETVRINRGIALGRYDTSRNNTDRFWHCGAEGGICTVIEATDKLRATDGDPLPENPCPSGGKGSTQCSIGCGPGLGCSTTCGPGTYACCHCTNGCHCYSN
jgi:hypothetical protein